MRFQDRVVLVAGGTGALGRAVVAAFLAEGARVFAVAREREGLGRLEGGAGAPGSRLAAVAADVADPAQAARAVAEAAGAGGRLDAVVNAAGGWAGGERLWEEPPDRLTRQLAANLLPGYGLARAAMPVLARQGAGALVEIASQAATGPQPGQASYAAAKAAARALFLSLAAEARPLGVRVNLVSPGTMDTEANRRAMPGADRAGWVAVEDVAALVLFLCSDAARAVSGADVPAVGGRWQAGS